MARAALTFDGVLALCEHLPGVQESTSYGTRAIKVKSKLIARLKEDEETIVLRVPFVVREFLLREQPTVFFITDHYRDWPMVLVRLKVANRKQLAELLEAAWRENAPPSSVRTFDGQPQG